jgi:hypothetical protein
MAHSLSNMDNYKAQLTNSSSEVFVKYLDLISEYLSQCVEAIYIRDDAYYKYIIMRGINTISHVFKILLLYTNNLDLTYYHCQKSFYYYVEFIGQIGDDNHSFLQLNSKDASLFVYKKTIFNVNNEYRKEFASMIDVNVDMNNVGSLIRIYNKMLGHVISGHEFVSEDKKTMIDDIDDSLTKLRQHLLNLSLSGSLEVYQTKLQLIQQFVDNTDKKGSSCIPYVDILARKLRKQNISDSFLQSKLVHVDQRTKLESMTALKYVNWLFLA